jgi:hypothetical protein
MDDIKHDGSNQLIAHSIAEKVISKVSNINSNDKKSLKLA